MKKTILTALAVTTALITAQVSWGQTATSSNQAAQNGANGGNGANGLNGDASGGGGGGGGGAGSGGYGGGLWSNGGNGGNGYTNSGAGGAGGTYGYGGANNNATGGGGGGGGGGADGGYAGANGSFENITWISGNTTISISTTGGKGGLGGNGGNGGLGGYGRSIDSDNIYYYGGAGGTGGAGGGAGGGGIGGSGGAIFFLASPNATLSGGITLLTAGADGGAGGNGGNGGSGGSGGYGDLAPNGTHYGATGATGVGGDGGAGAAGGNGGAISGTNQATLTNLGISAKSIGADGGNGGNGGSGSVWGTGGNGGNAGDAGSIMLLNTGSITTTDESAYGIEARSGGGNGGNGGTGSVVGLGGNGGNGGIITIANSGILQTNGQSAYGIAAFSYGLYGGADGNGVVTGAGGNGGPLTITNSGTIRTNGLYADGIEAYSGGGIGLTGGNGGNIAITNTGTIVNTGEETYGIYAVSYGAGGSVKGNGGSIAVNVSGIVNTIGADSSALCLKSWADGGSYGALSVNVSGLVSGGPGGTGICLIEGSQSTVTIARGGIVTTADGVNGDAVYSGINNAASDVINNSGLLIGSVNLVGWNPLGTGANTINNSGVFYSGTSIRLGAGNSLNNSGLFLVGGPGTVLTTSITGNYIESSTGVSGVKIGGRTQGVTYDNAVVSGTAYVDGTLRTYQLNKFVPNPVNARLGLAADSFTVLTANTLIIPASAKLDDYFVKNYLVKLTTYRNTNDLILVTKQSTFDTLFSGYGDGLSSNQRAVAKALDKAIVKSDWIGGTDSRADKLIERLDNIDKSHLRGALDEIAPEELGLLVDAGLGVVNTHQLSILGRLDQVRLTGWADPAPVASKDGKSAASVVEYNNGLYVVGNFGGFKIDDQDSINGGRDQSYGGTFGFDCRVSDDLRLGVAGSYYYNDLKFANGGKSDVNSGVGSLYASYLAGNFHVDGIIGGGAGSYDVTRKGLDGKTVTGDTDSAEIHSLLGAGYDIACKGFTFTPKASIAYTSVWMNGFTESGSVAPLKINDFDNTSSLKTRIGSSVNYTATVAHTPVTPEIGFYWQHEFMDPQRSVSARLASGAGGSFTVDSASGKRDSLVPTIAVNVKMTSNIDLRFAAEAELFNNTSSYNSEASVSISW